VRVAVWEGGMSGSSAVFYYRHSTVAGPVFLYPEQDGRYQVVFKHENLGTFRSPEQAAGEASDGLSALEISANIESWEKKLYAYVSS
jgi:hypothetical protein